MPDGRNLMASTKGDLPLLENFSLPQTSLFRKIPHLSHLLLSISNLCDNGCKSDFENTHCYIGQNDKKVLFGFRYKATKLWKIPLHTSEGEHKPTITSSNTHIICKVYQLNKKADIIHFLHACLFSPAKSTWLKDIKYKQFVTWTGII